MEVNTGKTKFIRCKKGGVRYRKVSWQWMDEVIEEVIKYVYLGYVFKTNVGQEDHVRESE